MAMSGHVLMVPSGTRQADLQAREAFVVYFPKIREY
jgi:hypothetical protein